MSVCYACIEYRRQIATLNAQLARLRERLAEFDDEPECVHTWILEADEQGDPHEAHLWADCSEYVCDSCGATRPVTDADRRRMKDEADYDRWESRR